MQSDPKRPVPRWHKTRFAIGAVVRCGANLVWLAVAAAAAAATAALLRLAVAATATAALLRLAVVAAAAAAAIIGRQLAGNRLVKLYRRNRDLSDPTGRSALDGGGGQTAFLLLAHDGSGELGSPASG